MSSETLKPLCFSSLLGLFVVVGSAHAQTSPATQQLINQGNYWQSQGREDLAAEVWRKLLSADPQQPDALLWLGLIDIGQGRRAEAQKRLQVLQASHPRAPQTARLRQALAGTGSGNPLQAARRAATSGRQAEAVRLYEALFGGAEPSQDLALEYYQALAGIPDGWERARTGLNRLVAQDGGNSAAALALARMLTYREPSRREGIAQLQALSQHKDVAGPARAAWRQALLWLNARQADEGLYEAFLAANPNDREVAALLTRLHEQGQTQTVQEDPNQRLLGEAFAALDANNLPLAENRFLQVLRARPRDPEALGGLGSVRLRQERFAEADELLRPAAVVSSKWRPAANAARYWLTLQEIRERADDPAAAIARLQQAIQLLPKEPAGYVALAGLQVGTDTAAAERNYLQALALDASNAGAMQGLIALYARQGRADEASTLFERLTAEQQQQLGGAASLRAMISRANAQQLLAAGNAAAARIELEDALLQEPANPWVRLDLARLYQQAGRPDQANSIMQGLLALAPDSAQALFANALFARENGNWAGAYANLEQIPPAQRDAEMRALHDLAGIHLQAAQARSLMQQNRAGEAQLLLARLESSLGERMQQPEVASALAGAYADIGSQQRALVLAQRLVSGPSPTVDDRLEYAAVLSRARQDAELSALLRQLQDTTLTAAQSRRYQELRSGYVLRQVDALRELGNLEAAYDTLAPILAQQPQDPATVATLARLYTAAGDPAQALVLYQQQLQLTPDDVDAMLAAAGSAAALRDLGLAEQYLQVALARSPDSPEVLTAAARVYRTAGKNRKAEQYFRAALAAQARVAGQVDHGYPLASNALVGSGGRAFNPFAGITGPGQRRAAVRSDTLPLPGPVPYATTAQSLPRPRATTPNGLPAAGDLPAPVTATTGSHVSAVTVPGARVDYAQTEAVRASVPASTALPAATAGVLDELREVQADNSNSLAVGAAYRDRDGEAGLGRVSDLEVPFEARFAMGEGKLVLGATPTILDSGRAQDDYGATSRFGSGPAQALVNGLIETDAPVYDLIETDLFRILTTNGADPATVAETNKLILAVATANGTWQQFYNQTDFESGDTQEIKEEKVNQRVLSEYVLAQFILDRETALATTGIGEIAREVFGDIALRASFTTDQLAQLRLLSEGSYSAQTPVEFVQTLNDLVAAATTAGSRRLGNQDAQGVGVSVGYEVGGFRVDIGSTPLGFRETRVVGGVGYTGQGGDSLTWNVAASRRAVSDSMLSFAGVEDQRSGLEWGGVTSTGVRLGGTLDNGLLGGYANLGWHRLDGKNVADNDYAQVDLGIYVHALRTDAQSLTAGLNLTALRYDRNLSGFTYGHGGYFSPQSYIDLGLPVHWTGRTASRRFGWQVDASVGVQHFREDDSPYFPTDPTLQTAAYDAASLAALLGISTAYVDPVYEGQTRTGISYNLSGTAEWQVAPQLFLGGRLEFNNARNYEQFSTNLYLRFLMDRYGASLGRQPKPLRSPYVGNQ